MADRGPGDRRDDGPDGDHTRWDVSGPDPADRREIRTGDRIATDLLRTALDPAGRRLPARRAVAVCLRAALFTDLALCGALVDAGRSPAVTDAAPPADRVLAAVHRTVAARPGVAWKRWYRHVDVDVEALAGELVAAGRWRELGRDLRGHLWVDGRPEEALALGLRARAVGLGEETPESVHEAVLGVLVVSCGGGGGAARPRDTRRVADLLAGFPGLPDARRRPVLVAVGTAQLQLRRSLFRYR